MNIFRESDLSSYLDSHLEDMRRLVKAEGKNQLLNVNEADFVQFLVDRYWVEPLVLHHDRLSVTTREVMIPAEKFPHSFWVERGKQYSKQVITYHLPYSGEPRLLSLRPSAGIMWTMEVETRNNDITFDIINFNDNADEIKRSAESALQKITQQCEGVNRQVSAYNSNLESQASQHVLARKQELLKQSNLLESLGVPLKTRSDVPETFAIPAPVKKAVIAKPTAPVGAYVPEPTLDEATFKHVLKLCQGTGIEIERHPAIYSGKDEETLRDHFIMVLSPHFQSVTGETFNKEGKTDILIRHEAKNAFVAECKFWRGEKNHIATINQILSYLTWRDSKAAIIYFVDNKNFNPVLEKIAEETPKHAAYVETFAKTDENWFNYRFHLSEDNTRNVFLSILCFHFPQ